MDSRPFSKIAVSPIPDPVAALYYDAIWPLSMGHQTAIDERIILSLMDESNMWAVGPDSNPQDDHKRRLSGNFNRKRFGLSEVEYQDLNTKIDSYIEKINISNLQLKGHGIPELDFKLCVHTAVMADVFSSQDRLSVAVLNADAQNAAYIFINEIVGFDESQKESNAIELAFMNIPAINDKNLSWEQVIQIKEDVDSISDLRKMKSFLFDNYNNKEESYIRDDIEQKIDNFKKAARKHGVETRLGAIKQILNSKSLLASTSVSVTAAMLGEPIVSASVLSSGFFVELGKLGIYLKERKLNKEWHDSQDELAYVHKLSKPRS